MAFFATRSVADESSLLGSLRVAVVGEPSVGKTALAELISSGQPAKGGIRSTAGAHIYVKLVERAQNQQDPGNEAQKRFFVELWDVSGQKKYKQLRSVFYKQLNGESVSAGQRQHGPWVPAASDIASLPFNGEAKLPTE